MSHSPEDLSETAVQFGQLLAQRRSIRQYQSTPVSATQLRLLLQAACWAPSAHNRQPWRFVVLESPASKTRLANAMGNQLRADRLADGTAPAVIEADVSRSIARIQQAPLVIVICMTLAEMDHYPDATRNAQETTLAVQSCAMAAQNLLLQAHACGLGACWMCAPLFCQKTVRDCLELPEDWQPQALITLGVPADSGKLRPRKALDMVVIKK